MADPAPYEVAYSFANFQTSDPLTPLPGVQIDNELAGVETAVAGLISSVTDVRRADGALKNAIVTVESLSPALLVGLGDFDAAAAAAIDASIAAVQVSLEADLADGLATKSSVGHAHAASEITITAIAGLVATTVQAALAELRASLPQPGDLQLAMNPTVRDGWRLCDDGTIGEAGSGATFASALARPLYSVLWTWVPDSLAPVTGGRGASAAADFAALKPIALTKMLGRVLAIAGAGSGLSVRSIGQAVGAETVVISQANLPNVTLDTAIAAGQGSHAHNFSDANFVPANQTAAGGNPAGGTPDTSADTTAAATLPAMAGTTPLGGSGTPTAIVQPTAVVYCFLKL